MGIKNYFDNTVNEFVNEINLSTTQDISLETLSGVLKRMIMDIYNAGYLEYVLSDYYTVHVFHPAWNYFNHTMQNGFSLEETSYALARVILIRKYKDLGGEYSYFGTKRKTKRKTIQNLPIELREKIGNKLIDDRNTVYCNRIMSDIRSVFTNRTNEFCQTRGRFMDLYGPHLLRLDYERLIYLINLIKYDSDCVSYLKKTSPDFKLAYQRYTSSNKTNGIRDLLYELYHIMVPVSVTHDLFDW